MKCNHPASTRSRHGLQGFTLTELVMIIVITVFLSGLLLAMPDRNREKIFVLTDLNNFRQILLATSMYQTENQDFLPHPTWGAINGGNSGPDGWAYAVANRGKITNGPSYIPSCNGRDTNSAQYATQVQFFKIGQLGPFLPSISAMYCPKDVEQWNVNPYKTWFLSRYQKITSYTMNGSVGGYTGPWAGQIAGGKTYQGSDFKSADIIYWEQNETDGFFFSDAGNNPETAGELLTQRHYGSGPVNQGDRGGGVIGRISGAAEFMGADRLTALATGPRPNDLLNGPGYRR